MISNEEKLLKERIRHLLSMKKMPISKIAKNESDRVLLGRQINGDNTSVPFVTIYRILYMFQDISADWLVMGEGLMLKAEHVAPHVYTQHNEVHDNKAGGDITVGSGTKVYPSMQEVEAMRKRIAELEYDKERLFDLVQSMTNSKNQQS